MRQAHIKTFEDFWPYYVSEHRDPTCRRLHFVGTSLALACALNPLTWPLAPVAGYGFAWVGHFFFEKNKPAAFDYPLWSLRADLRMWGRIARGRMSAELECSAASYPSAP